MEINRSITLKIEVLSIKNKEVRLRAIATALDGTRTTDEQTLFVGETYTMNQPLIFTMG